MPLGFGKLAVLESKLSIYEDLSKEMLDKLERAVGTISDNSNKIAIILERHENRLDESERTDSLILKMMEEIKDTHTKDREIIHDRITILTKKVDANAKFVVGCGAVVTTLLTMLQLAPPIMNTLTKEVNTSMIVSQVPPVNDLRR
tara:strand:- start:1671 stop:2108 length:438 start_codon:yes stop_codon:yes gene_type:complete